MCLKRVLPITVFVLLLAGNTTLAQNKYRTGFEFSTLAGVTMVQETDEEGDLTIVTFPQGAAGVAAYVFPAFRMTYWAGNLVLIDFGFSHFSVSNEGKSYSLLNIEGGLGVSFTPAVSGENKIIPYAGGLVGLWSPSEGGSQTDAYLGGQLGVRVFFRDHAAVKFQTAYRRLLGHKLHFGVIELAGGLSFFL